MTRCVSLAVAGLMLVCTGVLAARTQPRALFIASAEPITTR